MRCAGIIKDGEGGSANGGRASSAIGGVNSVGGRRVGNRSEVGDIGDNEVGCLGVKEGNGIEGSRSNVGSSKGGGGGGWMGGSARHEGAAGESGEKVIYFLKIKDRSSIRMAK